MDIARPILSIVFVASGIGALVLSIRSLQAGDRRLAVWTAFVVGLLTALLLIAEFTVME